ncbi:MAG TPA: 23S rRNA (guanosine(2251)-2'-O)-methyltransferase RlmB [Bacteroidetes bacterium]|nr:23S rRNA (guanosine(2251)-2'-O)-methyltransferase RlmB [Bacteroidota bacterium]
MILFGVNPVRAAIAAKRPIEKILISTSAHRSRFTDLLKEARERGIPVQFVPADALAKRAGTHNHQGIIAVVAEITPISLEELIEMCQSKEKHPLITVLDGIEDPHNLGAILRSAEAAGFCGAVVPKRHTSPLSPAVAKASAGAIEYLPIAKVENLTQALRRLKEQGFWIVGTDSSAEMPYWQLSVDLPLAVVIGSEGKGIRRLVKEHCDFLVRIPMVGKTESLNASVAAGILFFDILRKRQSQGS